MNTKYNSVLSRGVRHRVPRWLRHTAVVGLMAEASLAAACPPGVNSGLGFSLALTQQDGPQGYHIDCTTTPSSTPLTAADGDTGILNKTVSGSLVLNVVDSLGSYSVNGNTTASGAVDTVHGVFSAAATAKGYGAAESILRLDDQVTVGGGVGTTHATLRFLLDGRAFGNTVLPQVATGSAPGRSSTSSFADIGINISAIAGAHFQQLQLRNGGEFFGPARGFAGSFGPRQFMQLVNPSAAATPLTTTGGADSYANTLRSYDYNIAGEGMTLYSFDLGIVNAGDLLGISLQLNPTATCPIATMNNDCSANSQAKAYVSLLLDSGFTAHSDAGFNYDGIAYLASQSACKNPLGCGAVSVRTPTTLGLILPGLQFMTLLLLWRRRVNTAPRTSHTLRRRF